MDPQQHKTRIQLASNVFEACDYWAKANTQTLELHALARRNQSAALDLLRDGKGAGIRSGQDASKAGELVSSIRLLCAGAAGALLRPASASSPLQQPSHREAGAYLVEGEPKLAQSVLDTIEQRRAAAVSKKSPGAYAEYVMGVAAEYQSVLGAVAKAMALGPAERVDQAASRLADAGSAVARGLPAAAGVLAVSTGGNSSAARAFADAGLPEFIALESASRMLEAEFSRQRDELARRQDDLQARQEAERLAKNQRALEEAQAQARRRAGMATAEQR
jgi:hypothetical protein